MSTSNNILDTVEVVISSSEGNYHPAATTGGKMNNNSEYGRQEENNGPSTTDGNRPESQDEEQPLPTTLTLVAPTRKASMARANELILPKAFKDHFTLPLPSSTVRFRSVNSAVRVFESSTSQIVLEETLEPTRKIQVKKLKDATKNLQFLRAAYTVVCIFWTGILFSFCLQVLLTIILELSVQTGKTTLEPKLDVWSLIGSIIALLVFCRSFASAMVISSAFVHDAWTGHYLMKKIFFMKQVHDVVADWIFFAFFLLFPLLVMSFSLYSKSEDWWSITMLFWFACVALFYVIFAVNAVYFEVYGAFEFVRQREEYKQASLLDLLKRCIILKETHTYSGTRKINYIARTYSHSVSHDNATERENMFPETRREKMTRWAKLTMLDFFSREGEGKMPLFKPLDPPQLLCSIDDIQGNRPFVTKHTWSLERLYCRPRNSRYLAIIRGPGALTPDQIKSSVLCSFVALLLGFLIVTSLFTWMDFGVFVVVAGGILYLIFAVPNIRYNMSLANIAKQVLTLDDDRTETTDDVVEQDNDANGFNVVSTARSEEANQAIYLVTEVERVTQITERACWIMFGLEVAFLFVFPLATLFWTGNFYIGVLFLIAASVNAMRYYIDLIVVIEETGNMDVADGATPEECWVNQSRLSGVIQAISHDKSRLIWSAIMAGFGLMVLGILLGAVGSSNDPNTKEALNYIPTSEYYYPHAPKDVRYPTCDMNTEIYGENATLADFAFLSVLAYHPDDVIDGELKSWFGDEVVSKQATVDTWKNSSDFKTSPVVIRLFHFPKKETAVVAIKGTSNAYDLLADSQLWSTAMLVQALRALLPLGSMWTPILDELVQMVNRLKSDSIERVSFYKATSDFVKYLKEEGTYKNIQVTGHSLGGGLAIITGAQTGIPAVALSGPNARLSGSSFQPKVTYEQLNQYTFNIVPNNDMVARFDDLADQFQKIECTAPPNKFMECHFNTRSLCEILFRCGSGNRPVYCLCHQQYGYDEPTALPGARNLSEICPAD